jgi:hypothetical protein
MILQVKIILSFSLTVTENVGRGVRRVPLEKEAPQRIFMQNGTIAPKLPCNAPTASQSNKKGQSSSIPFDGPGT